MGNAHGFRIHARAADLNEVRATLLVLRFEKAFNPGDAANAGLGSG